MVRGGGERNDLELIELLARKGYEVSVVAGRPLLRRARYTELPAPANWVRSPWLHDVAAKIGRLRIPSRGLGGFVRRLDDWIFWRFAWRVYQEQFLTAEVVYCFGAGQIGLAEQIIRSGGRAVVFLTRARPTFDSKRKESLSRLSGLVVVAQDNLEKWGALNSNVRFVTGGIRPPPINGSKQRSEIRERLGLGADDFCLIVVGRLVPTKNVEFVIRALSAVRSKTTQRIVLLVLGDGPLRNRLRFMAKQLDLQSNVVFLGNKRHRCVWGYYRAADVYVSASTSESFGLCAIEAMSTALAVVASRTGIVKKIVRDGFNGYTFAMNDMEVFIERIVGLANSPSLRKRLGDEGRATVGNKFSWGVVADEIDGMFLDIIKNARVWEKAPDGRGHMSDK